MVLLGVLPLEADGRAPVPARGLPGGEPRACVRTVRALLEKRDQLLMADVARGGEDDVLCSIGTRVVAGEHPPRDRRDDLGATDHRASEGMRPEDRLSRDVVD